MIHKNITIYGIVQGVGFRFSARETARAFGIKGYVKNLPDGNVFIEAEGQEFNVNKFLKWCNTGPSHAYVSEVDVTDGPIKNYNVFDIKF